MEQPPFVTNIYFTGCAFAQITLFVPNHIQILTSLSVQV